MSDSLFEGIAIVGVHGRFPGAQSVEEFWRNLVCGKDSISFFSDDELSAAGLDVDAIKREGDYVPARGVLQDAQCFDATFFGIQPKVAEVMDPQQRVFLEGCWEALERAGYAPDQIDLPVGIFAGATSNTYYLHALHPRPELIDLVGQQQVMFGNEKDYMATRVAYKLNLRGPAITLSTACSTSLAAVCQACQSLLTFQCDMAIAGGVSVIVPQTQGYYFQEGSTASPDGRTRTFDAQSRGMVSSNGMALVVLKRLEEAQADGDQIYAVIRGFALNNDGRQRVSLGAPGVEGQSEVVAMAQEMAGVQPDSISYVEAHGTATPVGDPIEVAALTKAFRRQTQRKQFCAVGSVKSNIGHLDVAAGAAGLIKTALALKHQKIPASLHFTEPNPRLELEQSPFYVNSTLREWKSDQDHPRYAGVSSFGLGGSNAHVIVEEAPPVRPSDPSRPAQLILLSAKTPETLEASTQNLAAHLKNNPDINLADAAFTLQRGRSPLIHRRAFTCIDAHDALTVLQTPNSKRLLTAKQEQQDPPVVFMFPGQGAQFVGMGADLYEQESVFREVVDRCAELLLPSLQEDLRHILFPTADHESEASEKIRQTRFTQPALFVVEYALATLWMSWGIRPTAMIGHSVGEFVAACLAGVLKLEDALSLLAYRAELVQSMPPGSMLAVRLPEAEVLPFLSPQLAIAAVNSPALCVVAGPHESVDELGKQLSDRGVMARRLRTSHAFHSQMMDPVIEPFTEVLRAVEFGEPKIPYVSNVTAEWIKSDNAQSPEYWAGHVRQAVRFSDGIEKLLQDPTHILLEVGPGSGLTQLALQHPARDKSQRVVTSMPYSEDEGSPGVLAALGSLWLAGANVDWQAFYANETRRRIVLPTYPFERTRYWPDTPVATSEVVSKTVDLVENGAAPNTPTDLNFNHEPVSQPVTQPTAPAVPEIARKDRLIAEIRSQLEELSGTDMSSADASVSLFEFGFDSLLLTQVATLLRKKFRAKITFRQLMEELSTIDAIASYLDAALPAEPERKPVAETVRNSSPSGSSDLSSGVAVRRNDTPSGDGQSYVALLEQHLAATAELLNKMRQRPEPTSEPQPNTEPKTAITIDSRRSSALSAAAPRASHGPYKPLDRGQASSLTTSQQKRLDKFIARYTKRTATSKKLAAQNRPLLADPRSVAGFKSAWKEAVYPIHTNRSNGSKIWDVDGNEYVDFVMGFGASLFGHRPPFVVEAVKAQLDAGFETGPIHPMAGEVASLVQELTGAQRVGFCGTGSEAVLAAIRVARTVTARDKIVIFEGAYHGVFDEVLARPIVRNGELRSMPTAPGIPAGAVGEIIVLQYGNSESLEIIEQYGDEIAAVLVEPVQARRLDLVPTEFLHQLRQLTSARGAALVFDEVVTGFRVEPGGAQAYFGIDADLATYGKVVGGGLPIGIIAGKAMYLDALDGGPWQFGDDSAPEIGVTFFAGTFVRHPLALAAAKSVLTHVKQQGPELQVRVAQMAESVATGFRGLFDRYQAPFLISNFSSLIYLSVPPEFTYGGLLFCHLRDRGIHIFENRLFVFTTAHTKEDTELLLRAMEDSLKEMQQSGLLPKDDHDEHVLPTGQQDTRPAFEPPVFAAVDETNKLALTQAQREIWLAAVMGEDSFRAYNTTFAVRIQGPLDRQALESSLQELVNRHDSLRAAFDLTNPVQHYLPNVKLEIPHTDFSALDKTDREQRFVDLARYQADQHFDISTPPLCRVQLVCFDSQEHRMVLTVSHLVADGWSVGVLLHELKLLYAASIEGTQPPLQPAMQFSEYLHLQNAPGHQLAVQKAEEYWQKQFSTLPTPVELPTVRQRSPQKTYHAGRQSVVWDEEFTKLLRRASAEHRTTLLNFLLAGFKALLQRLSGQEDIVVGIPAAGQISSAMESTTGSDALVGHCVNLLPVRSHCQQDQSFQTYLKSLKSELLDAYDHQSLTFSKLLELLQVPRELNRMPLVPIIFNLDRARSGFEMHGLDVSVEELSRSSIVFDIFCNIVDDDKHLRIDCEFNTDLLDAVTMKRWLEYYRNLLMQAATSAKIKIEQIDLLSDEERRQMLVEWNETQRDYPSSDCLHRLFERQAERTPDKIAVRFAGQTINYAELERRANQLAHYLKDRGAGPEVLIGICTDRSIDMVVGLLGILKAGAAYVPIDPEFPKDRIAFMLEDSATRILVTQDAFANHLPTQGLDVVCLDRDADAWSNCSDVALHTEATAENLAYVIFTSGSTGRPKGVQISHRAFINFLNSMQHTPGMSAEDTLLAVTTLSFDIAGLEIFLPLITGATVEMVNSETGADAVKLMDSFEQSRATIMQATPATWRMLIEAGWRGTPDLKVLCGGEAMPRDLIDPLLACCGELWNMYGPTETTVWSSLERIRSSDGLISVGRPIDNTQMYILDKQLQPVPVGVTGELYIGGDGLARGYLKRPDLTKERFIQDPFSVNQQARLYNTGDLARHSSDGRIECLGRKDQQVKIRGYRIELGEIEAVLSMHPQVRESAVVDREFAPGDVRLVAYVVFMPDATESPSDLQAALRNQLPNYMMPSSFVTLNELPQTPNGKLDRKSLASMDVVATRIEETFQAPSDQIELHLCRLWEELLNVKPIGVRDDFFNLGGHSLLSVQLMVRIEETYGKRLPLATLLQARTIAGLAKILRSGNWQPKWRSLVPMREAGSSTPLFLFHSHGGNVLEYNSLVSQLPTDRPVYALQARGLDGDIPTDNSIVDMARYYIQEIREFQPEGPYYLVGYCFGGCLALEAACQLEEAGEEVVFVGLIQSMTPKYTRYMNGGNWFAKSYRRVKRRAEVELNEFHQIGPKFLLARLIQLKEKVQGRMEVWLESVRKRPDASHRKSSLPHILELLSRENEKAFWQHHPKSCSCPVTLFPGEKQLRSRNVDPALGWHEVLDTQTSIHKVSGHQQSLLKMPHVKVLANRLNACILAAEHSDTKNETIEYDDRLLAETAN